MTEAFVYTSALRDFLRLRRIMVWIVVGLGLFAMAFTFRYLNPDATPRDAYYTLSSLLVFRVLPLASAIFSSAVIGQEVEQRTIVYLLTRPVERWKLILFRTLASATAVTLVSLFAMAMVGTAVFGNPFSNPGFFNDAIAIVVGSLAYGTLFVAVSLLISKSAMVVCLLFAFAWETSVPSMPGSMSMLSVSTYLTAIAQRPATSGGVGFFGNIANSIGVNSLSSSTAWPMMILMIAGCGAFSMWWFSRSEFLPREDV